MRLNCVLVLSRFSRTAVTKDRMLRFVKKALFSLVWHTKMSSVFVMGRSTNSMAWKLVNQMSKVRASSHEYPHVEKLRIFVNRISNLRQTTLKQLDSEDSQRSNFSSWYLSLTLVWNILILLFVLVASNTARIGPYCNMKPRYKQ